MVKKIVIFLFISLLIFPQEICWSKDSTKNQIKKINISGSGSNLILNFELSKIATYNVFALDKPDRLVIDFENTTLSDVVKVDLSKYPLFESFRSAKRDESYLRVVFNLKKKIKAKSTLINPSSDNPNYRLSLEISTNESEESKKDVKKYSLTPLNSEIADKILAEDTIKLKPISRQRDVIKITPKKNLVAKESKKIIVIDAGHGGKDPGAIGEYARTKEKNVTLAFAKEIKRYLDENKKFKVYLTRDDDYFIPLAGRVQKSRDLKADLFISIHADSAENTSASGLSIYTLSENSSDKEAEKLANKENKSDIIGGANFAQASGDIIKTLIDLSQRSTMNNSAKFAEFTIDGLAKNEIEVKHNTHRFAGFRVLTSPEVPSVLIELGYLSNKENEENLNSTYYRRKFSKVLTDIIDQYFTTRN